MNQESILEHIKKYVDLAVTDLKRETGRLTELDNSNEKTLSSEVIKQVLDLVDALTIFAEIIPSSSVAIISFWTGT